VGTTPVGWVTTKIDLSFDGIARSYLLSRPAHISAARLPVLVELHGCCVTPAEEEQRSGFMAVAGPAILVYPAGIGESWNAGSCCYPAHAKDVDDVGFLTAVVRQVEDTIDMGPVYLAGYSNGGKMALTMACARPHLFAAVAVYGAVSAAPCAGPPPVSMLEVASTDDPDLAIGPGSTLHSVGGFVQPTLDAQVDAYIAADKCKETETMTSEGTLTSWLWAHCAAGRRVQLSLYTGGGHGWPRGGNGTPSAEQVMWAFFSATGGADS
jgi:polyhydroxybutyrate depolymerase